jgi:cytochrome oxidase Cu insertion factor (SCO1/SenC/PrrC family)
MSVIGIDPGMSGGIALIKNGNAVVAKMGHTERDTYEILQSYAEHEPFAYIESVHSMPKQGVASSFKFGVNYGLLRGMLIAIGIPFETVTPLSWQRYLRCQSKGDKNVTKAKAQELFPHIKVTHSTADALLIAEYGRRINGTVNGHSDS